MKRRNEIWAPECIDCGCYLNALEEECYGIRCEDCEGLWVARIEAWRSGEEDPYLDELMEAS